MKKTVNEVAASWSKLGQNYAESRPHKHGLSLAKLITLARPQSQDLCLDIGTGAGHTAAALAAHAKHVYGLDPSEGMRQAAQDMYGHLSNIEFVDGTSEQTGFDDESFDIVTARHTLHHHPNIEKTMLELARILKPGGRLVIVDEITPNELVNEWYHELEVTRDPTHLRAYYLSEWKQFIKKAALTWVVGDAETHYPSDAESWILRQNPSAEQAEKVRELFRNASDVAKETFAIQYENNNAVSFSMPMALILAVK